MIKKIDFLAIGDITIDAFIRLKEANVTCNTKDNSCILSFPFANKIPYESVTIVPAAGNAGNAATSAARLGLNSYLLTNVGHDDNGRICVRALKNNGVKTDLINLQKGKNTNYHYVLWYENDRTILLKHIDFNYKLPKLLEKTDINWIYFTSLSEYSLEYHIEIAKFLKRHPNTNLAFQPGTFQFKLGIEKLRDIYMLSKVFFCNLEEASRLTNIKLDIKDNSLESIASNVRILSKAINNLGPKIVVITNGPQGSYLYLDNELWYINIYPDIAPPFERTGAGDSFSSTFVSAMALGKSPLEAFTWGPINAMSVSQKIGAQEGLLTRKKLLDYLRKSPKYYKPIKLYSNKI